VLPFCVMTSLCFAFGCQSTYSFEAESEYELSFTCSGPEFPRFVPQWGSDEMTVLRGADCSPGFAVWMPRDQQLSESGEVIEIYSDDTGALQRIPGMLVRDRVQYLVEGELHYDALFYDLSELPDGPYCVVHRRSAAPEGLEPVGFDSWGTFEGEDALLARVVLEFGSER